AQWHRFLVGGAIRHRDGRGHLPARHPLLSVVPLYVVPYHAHRRYPRSIRVPENIAARQCPLARARGEVSVHAPPRSRPVEAVVSARLTAAAGPVEIGHLEPR